jgi:hypothetical protein
MKLLTFQAKRFWWRSFSKTLESVEDIAVEQEVVDAVVAFYQVEAGDAENRASVFRQALKHLKWLANKREMRTVVLHSFTHLGGDNAEPDFARDLTEELAVRLRETGYTVWITPFGYFNEWDLSVYGESLAKVWKQI